MNPNPTIETTPVPAVEPAPANVQINVAKAFTLTHQDNTRQKFEKGLHNVTHAISEHWFVKAHTAEPAEGQVDANAEYEKKIADLQAQIAELTKNAKGAPAVLDPLAPPVPDPKAVAEAKAKAAK
jgi:valyl-tRNA synthetase